MGADVVIIANPAARRAAHHKIVSTLNRVKERLQESGCVDLIWQEHPGEATVIARSAAASGAKLVIGAGGDGTLHEIANGLAGTQTAMSVLPLGTENVLARFLGFPSNPDFCVREILRRPKRRIDLGKIGDRYFLLFLGIGFDAQVVKNTNSYLKKAIGSFAFALTAVREFWQRRNTELLYHIDHDGVAMDVPSWFLLVGNIPRYGWQLPMLPSADPEDGKLDACIFPSGGFWNRLRQTACVFRGNHYEETRCFQFKTLSIASDIPIEIQADGEFIGTTPCEISVAPKSLWVQF